MVTERNWLLVFPWASWGGNANLPHFEEGQTFVPSELLLRQGATAPPPRLSERDLIAAMERHGIGTDATVAGARGCTACAPVANGGCATCAMQCACCMCGCCPAAEQ